jgi:hypothetical protein
MLKTDFGWPLTATHYREPQRGQHVHVVCSPDGSCTPHVDQWNPTYLSELWPHLRDDFWPEHKRWAGPALAVAAILVLSKLVG